MRRGSARRANPALGGLVALKGRPPFVKATRPLLWARVRRRCMKSPSGRTAAELIKVTRGENRSHPPSRNLRYAKRQTWGPSLPAGPPAKRYGGAFQTATTAYWREEEWDGRSYRITRWDTVPYPNNTCDKSKSILVVDTR